MESPAHGRGRPANTPEELFHFAPSASPPAAAGSGAAPTGGTQSLAIAGIGATVPEPADTRRRGAQPGEKVLITGIAGGQGRLIARRLMGTYELTGVDRHPWEGHPPEIGVHVLDLRKRKFEDIIRTERPQTIVHHALIRHFAVDPRVRHEVNVLGTKRLLEYCAAYGVQRVLVLSSSYVYGALPDNSLYLDEESPLNVSRTYPEVRDLAEVDSLVTQFLWRHPEIQTTILRPVSTLGYYVSSAMGRYLRARWVPVMAGFDPMMQFIHEEDVAEAVALALECGTHGIYNLVGPGAVPLSVAIRETGGIAVPLPEILARPMFELLFDVGLYHTPSGAIDFIKYPVTLDGRRFVQATGFTPLFSLEDIFASVRH